MAVKTYKPTTPSRRFMTAADFSMLSDVKPEKSLVVKLKKQQAETLTEESLLDTEAAATNLNTELLTLKEIRLICPQQL